VTLQARGEGGFDSFDRQPELASTVQKEPKMSAPDAICELEMHNNAFAAGAMLRTPTVKPYGVSPKPLR